MRRSDCHRFLVFASLLPLSGCVEVGSDRAAWVCNTLVADNLAMANRDVERVEAKFQVMASDPYLWFRGSAGLFFRDVVDPANAWSPGSETSEAGDVLLIGDPHLENIGTYLDVSGSLRAEFNDFDAALYGAYWLDVWRLATGFVMLDEAGLAAGSPGTGRSLARWVAEGYRETMESAADGTLPSPLVDNGEGGEVLAELFAKARKKGLERDELADETILTPDGRKFRFAAYPERQPKSADLLLPLTYEEEALLERLYISLEARASAPTGSLLGFARRQGAGVASMPNLRFYLLLAGPTGEASDDLILEVKELADPPLWVDPVRGDTRNADDQGERVVTAQRLLQGAPQTDAWLQTVGDGQQRFRVRHFTDYQSSLDHEDAVALLRAGRGTGPDARLLARAAGRLLATSHLRAPMRSGGPSGHAIRASLARDPAGFDDTVVRVAAEMGLRTYSDYLIFHAPGAVSSCLTPWSRP